MANQMTADSAMDRPSSDPRGAAEPTRSELRPGPGSAARAAAPLKKHSHAPGGARVRVARRLPRVVPRNLSTDGLHAGPVTSGASR